MEFKYCKLEIFIPETKILELQKALQESGRRTYWKL